MSTGPITLGEVSDHCWQRLVDACASPTDPMRIAVLGTSGSDGAAMRAVVIRAVDVGRRHVICHTDRRSTKVRELAAEPRVAWQFYDPDTLTQIRLRGEARVLTQPRETAAHWALVAPETYRNYLAEGAPGTPAPSRTADLAPGRPGAEDAARARENFALVESTIWELDWVQLSAKGNARAIFRWTEGAWSGGWAVP
jgi:hypothetical protein